MIDEKRSFWYHSPYMKPRGAFLRGKNMQKILTFLTEAKAELLRVNWPSQKQLVRYTVLVIAISLVMAVFLGGLDLLFSSLVERYLIK